MHAAAKAGKIALVKHLVGLGADVAHRNSYRQTAYDVATSHIVRQYLLPLQLRVRLCVHSWWLCGLVCVMPCVGFRVRTGVD